MAASSCGAIDIYDYGDGSILVAWPPFPGVAPSQYLLTGAGKRLITGAGNELVVGGGGGAVTYNVYVNGVLATNVPIRLAVINGLFGTSYNPGAIPSGQAHLVDGQGNILTTGGGGLLIPGLPGDSNGPRPQSMPPTGLVTDSLTYDIRVVVVVGGVEQACSLDRLVTIQPTSIMLVTPMKRPFPFPNTAPGG